MAFPIPTVIDFLQVGTGLVSFAAAGGVTINSKSSILFMNGQWSGCSLVKTATNTWDLVGVGQGGLPSRMVQITSNTTTTSTTWVQLLTTGAWTTSPNTNYLDISFTTSVDNSNTNTEQLFQCTLDGTDICVTGTWVAATLNPATAAMIVRVACSGNASHTVVINWRTTGGTATIDPTQTHTSGALLMHANLVIKELAQ